MSVRPGNGVMPVPGQLRAEDRFAPSALFCHQRNFGSGAEGELGHGSGKSVAPMYPHSDG